MRRRVTVRSPSIVSESRAGEVLGHAIARGRGRTASVLLVISVLVAACSSSTASDTVTPATVSSTITTETAPTTRTTVATTTTTVAATTTSTLPDPALLVGTWLDPSVGVHVTFDDDGNHYVSYVGAEPFEYGPYTLDGARLTMVADEGSGPKCVGLGPGVYDIVIGADASWMFGRVVSDSCAVRAMSLTASLSRVEGTD